MEIRSHLETKVLAAFSASVLVVVLLAGVTWKVSRDAVEAALWVAHTQEVLVALGDVDSGLRRAESSARGYIITSDQAFLAERDEALSQLENAMRQVKGLTADNARQQQRWARLRETVDARVALIERSVLLRATEGFEPTRELVVAQAHLAMQRVGAIVREMEDEERDLLRIREAEQTQLRAIAAGIGVIASLVLAILLSVTYFVIRRQIRATEASRRALRESEENLSTTLHSIGDAVLATDTEGRVTRMNPVAERLTGWPFAEAQGRPVGEVFRIVNEQTRAPAVMPVAKVLATGEVQGLANHSVLIARDGAERPVADSAAPIRDAGGRVSGVVLVFRDVTDERRAEQTIREQNELLEQRVRDRTAQLRESEERLNFALQTSHTGGWDLDLVDHTAHRTLEHDRIFGYGSLLPQWTYEMFLEHVLPEDRAEVDRRFREATAAQTEWRFECRIRRVDGEVRWILAAGEHQRDEAGQTRRMAGIVQDITERKRAEQEIRDLNASLERRVAERTAQLEAANKELEAFSYSVSHDLRAPLRAIDGFSRIVEEDYAGRLDLEGRRLLGVIRDNSRKMAQLIDDLLEYSRLGRKPLSTDAIDMKRLVEEVFGELQVSGERSHRLVLAALPPARGDATLVKQAWTNLLANAIKFSGKREQPLIEVSGDGSGVECVYCVKDNGAGFDMRYYEKLFKVFQRLHREEEFEGTGVGLAIVQRIVSRQGGRVWAEGKVDDGAAFYFSLPKGRQDGQI